MSPLRLRVKKLREAQGMTQTDLAKRAGLRRATLIDIEMERTNRVEFDVLERLADALGVDPGFLIERLPAKRGR